MKPNCYKCKFRDCIPGDAHSQCTHPEAINIFMAEFLYGGSFIITKSDGSKEPLISGDPHGIRNGWFAWPFNFDPVWLVTCYLYQGVEK